MATPRLRSLPLWILAPLAILACGGGGSGARPPVVSLPPHPPPPPVPPANPSFRFEAKPYLQLGNNPGAPDRLSLLWQTLDEQADWVVEIQGQPEGPWLAMAPPASRRVAVTGMAFRPHRVWIASLQPLEPGGVFSYRLLRDGTEVFRQAGARALKGPGQPQRIAVTGDLVDDHGPKGLAVADQIYAQHPDLMVAVGDLVYPRGTVGEYRDRFFPAYNGDQADPAKGAPFMRGTPMVAALGNHDVDHVGRKRVPPRDGLAYFYYWDQPLNGPDLGRNVPNLSPPADWTEFRKAAGERFPRMGNFSFRSGDVHWTILDSNLYMNWGSRRLRDWLRQDLAAARDVPWRFVAFHHPPYNVSSANHTGDWHMAQVWPILQEGHVDLVFTGHLHTYQRTTPMTLKPRPDGVSNKDHCADEANLVPDRFFDGAGHTRAQGPIQILTGGGGGFMHRTRMPGQPKPFHAKVVIDRHGFSLLEVDGNRVSFRQLSETGEVLDAFTLTH